MERKQLQRSTELLKQVKANVLGYILNGINAGNDDYYHYYYYRSSYQNEPIDKMVNRPGPAKKVKKNKHQANEPMIRNVAMPHPDGGFGLPEVRAAGPNQYATNGNQAPEKRNIGLQSEDD